MVFEKTRVIGTSTASFTDAADDAIEHATERYDEVLWIETSMRGVELASVEEPEYQVEAVVAFRST